VSPEDLAAYAARLVNEDRAALYGHPLDNLTRAASIWSVILNTPVTAEQVSLCMVGLKIARQVHRETPDNIADAVGYLLTYGMIGEERARRDRSVKVTDDA
jgi:hypothetical protein